MITRIKKIRSLAILAAGLIAVSILFAACPVALPDFGSFFDNGNQAPAYLSVSIGEGSERTILPGSAVNAGKFGSITLNFIDNDTVAGNDFEVHSLYATRGNIPLAQTSGTYTVEVTVFTDTTAAIDTGTAPISTTAIASGTAAAPITLQTGSNSIEITVNPLAPGSATGNGTFTWNITLPTEIKNSTMTISTGTPTVVSLAAGANAETTGEALAAGYYNVDLSLEREYTENTRIHEATYFARHALHIYQNMESNFNESILATAFNPVPYDVIFNPNTGSGGNVTVKVLPESAVSAVRMPSPELSGHTFRGWYTANGGVGTPANPEDTAWGTQFAAVNANSSAITLDKDNNTMTVYARWAVATASGNVTINLVVSDVSGTIVADSVEEGGKVTLEIEYPSTITIDTIEVWCNNEDVGSNFNPITANTAEIDIDTSLFSFFVPVDTYNLSVIMIDADGKEWSAQVDLTVIDPVP